MAHPLGLELLPLHRPVHCYANAYINFEDPSLVQYQPAVKAVFALLKFTFRFTLELSAERGSNLDAICFFIFALEALTALSEHFLLISTLSIDTILLFVAVVRHPQETRGAGGASGIGRRNLRSRSSTSENFGGGRLGLRDEMQAQYTEQLVVLGTVVRSIFVFCSVMCSGWALGMLPLLYDGNNKKYLYTIDVMEDDGFWKVMGFSAIKFVGEVVSAVVG